MSKRYVTLAEANALIPVIGGVLHRVMQLHALLRYGAEQLSGYGLRLNASLIAGEDLFGVPEIDRLIVRSRVIFLAIRDDISLLEDCGCEVRDIESGLVDFRSLRDGVEEVHLCWRIGEREITTWHLPAPATEIVQKSVEGQSFMDQPAPARESRVD